MASLSTPAAPAALNPSRLGAELAGATPKPDAAEPAATPAKTSLIDSALNAIFKSAKRDAATANPTGRIGADSGLPLPRWAALSSDRVNMRTGPGRQYPISWSYQRRGLPVEIVEEHEYFRRIRDVDGTEGWVHKSMLSGKRSALVTGAGLRDILPEPNPAAEVDMQAEPGVQVRLVACRDARWCEVEVVKRKGYMERTALWGLYPGEMFK